MSKFINQMERRWGDWSIPHLTRWIVLFNALGYILIYTNSRLASLLFLNASQVMEGQIWRLVTYLFLPPPVHPIWIVCALYFTYLIGEGLEQEWGAFKLNLYYAIGMAATTVIAFFFEPGDIGNTYLNTSLFLAFATIYPDYLVYLLMIMPVKVKWLGWFTAAVLCFSLVTDPIPVKLAIAVSVANYFLFFGKSIWEMIQLRRQNARVRVRFHEAAPGRDEAFHRCFQCGKTEISHPELHFRVAKNGEEFCVEHLPKIPLAESQT